MKKNLLVLALLGLSISTLAARHRDVLTNGRTNGVIDPQKQQQKDDARAQREQDNAEKAAEKAARAEEVRLARADARAQREQDKADKEAAKKLANPKLTKSGHANLARVHETKTKKIAAQVQDVMANLENFKTKRRTLVSAHKDRVANTPDSVKQAHLLNVRYAGNRLARKAAVKASAQAHGTAPVAQVQDVTDAILDQRATLTDLNAQYAEAKGNARRHHANAGTLAQYEERLRLDLAGQQVAKVKEVKGVHRFTQAQQNMADKRDAVRAQRRPGKKRNKVVEAVVNVEELQEKVRRVEALIAQARKDKATYFANLEKKQLQAKRLAQVKQQKAQTKHLAQVKQPKWSAPKLSPVV